MNRTDQSNWIVLPYVHTMYIFRSDKDKISFSTPRGNGLRRSQQHDIRKKVIPIHGMTKVI